MVVLMTYKQCTIFGEVDLIVDYGVKYPTGELVKLPNLPVSELGYFDEKYKQWFLREGYK